MAVLVSGGASYIASAAATTTAGRLPTRPSVVGGLLYQSVAYDSGRTYILPNGLPVLNKPVGYPVPSLPNGFTNLGLEYYNVVMADAPTAYWRLDETASIFAIDSAGGSTGTYTASPVLGAAGALVDSPDFAATFTAASSQYVDIAPKSGYVNGPYSGECWFSMSSSGANFAVMEIPGINGASGAIGMSMGNLANGKLTVIDGANRIVSSASAGYNNGVIHHAVFTKIVAGNVWSLYIDGVDVTTADSTPNVATSDVGPARGAIGCDYNGGTRRWFFTGLIDEVAHYNVALTLAQVQNHYNVGLAYLNDRALSVMQAVNRAATF